MGVLRVIARAGPALAVAVALCAAQGCTTLAQRAKTPGEFVGLYLQDRLEDAAEMADIGFSVTKTPQFSLYGDGVSVGCGGIGCVDGYVLGLAGGRVGLVRHYQGSVGLVAWGYEEVGWGEFDKDDLSTLNCQGVGIIGLLLPPYGRPASAPA